MKNELVAGTDFKAQGETVTGSANARSEFRSLQADLNQYAKTVGFEGVMTDGIIGPKTLEAVQGVIKAVLASNSLLVPAEFATPSSVQAVATSAPRIRDWLHSTAALALKVSPFRTYTKGAGKDWNLKGDIAYGAGAVHDQFMALQKSLNSVADSVGFHALDVDGFIGSKTAAAVKATYDKTVARSPFTGVTMFPVPDTKEETAEYAAFIQDWLQKVALPQLPAAAPV